MSRAWFSSFVVGAIAFLGVTSASLAAITVQGDEVRIETCGFPASEVYGVQVQRTGLKQGGRTNDRGCLKTTFRDGKARSGDNLIIEVAGRRSSETVPGSSGGQPPPPPAPVDTRETVDLRKARETGENQARFFANRVVIVYGSQENYRYNLHHGLRQGVALYNWSTISGVQNTIEFREGYANGRFDGQREGEAAGRTQGSQDGSASGVRDAFGRFKAVVDQNRAPDVALRVPDIRHSGLTASRTLVSIEERLGQMDSIVRSQLGSLRFGDSEYALGWQWDDYWSPRVLYGWSNYQDNLVRGWYRDDRALQLYRQRALGGNYGQMLEYLDRISDSNRTKNANEALSAFESGFRREYDQVIDSKWWAAVSAYHPLAQALGIQLGQEAVRGYTRDLGFNTGYAEVYTQVSAQTYPPAYRAAFRDSFEATVRRYDSEAILGGLEGRVTDASGGDRFFVGGPVAVLVSRLVNFGRQNAHVEVRANAGLVSGETKSFDLGYSSSLSKPRLETGIGRLQATPKLGESATVTVRVGGLELRTAVTFRWDVQVAALASQGAANSALLGYIVENLATEWEKVNNTLSKNHYDASEKTNDTLLEQLVRTAQSLDPAERQRLRQIKTNLKQAYGKAPGFFGKLAGKARKYKSAMALIDQI